MKVPSAGKISYFRSYLRSRFLKGIYGFLGIPRPWLGSNYSHGVRAMASEQDVRSYLICWWQLGKSVIHHTPGGEIPILPQPLFDADQTSPAVEALWAAIRQTPEQFYLAGSTETLGNLLSDSWEVVTCSRCQLPVPLRRVGIQEGPCPCSDLEVWPSRETLPPRTHTGDQLQARLRTLTAHFPPCPGNA